MSELTFIASYAVAALLFSVLFAVWKARDSGELTLGDLLASLTLGAAWPAGAPLFLIVLVACNSGGVVVWRRK
ncbi:MAG: hypothetical protein V4730_11900 [Pseudomonadota bacterium]